MKNINFLASGDFKRQQASRIAACFNTLSGGDTMKKSEDDELEEKKEPEENEQVEDKKKEAPKQEQEKEVEKSMSPFDHQAMMKSRIAGCYGMNDEIKKSGEGSRGGKVIGHTASGKPVYGDGRPASGHHGFTPEDHRDAKDLHTKEAAKHEKGSDKHKQHSLAASEHGDRSRGASEKKFKSNKHEEKEYHKIRNKVNADHSDKSEDQRGRIADKIFKDTHGVEYMANDYGNE